MKLKQWLIALTAVMAVAGSAAAVKKGESLYVTARNVRLQKDSSPTSGVLATLQPGQEVKWLGADAANKQWHKVNAGGKEGVVFQSNLSPKKPASEVVAAVNDGKPIDPQAFASSGAATKALSGAGLKYAEAKQISPEVPKQVLTAEALSAQTAPEEVTAHAKKVGITSAYGAAKAGGK